MKPQEFEQQKYEIAKAYKDSGESILRSGPKWLELQYGLKPYQRDEIERILEISRVEKTVSENLSFPPEEFGGTTVYPMVTYGDCTVGEVIFNNGLLYRKF